jgi:hypothetical protein
MKIATRVITEDGFDLRKEMKRLGYTLRSLGEKTGLHFAYLQKIASGQLAISKEQSLFIRNKMVEPKSPLPNKDTK